jgi:hypothetical protein
MNMAKYRVTVKEVWNRDVIIEAEDSEQAMNLVEEGRGVDDPDSFELNYCLEQDQWDVEKEI